MKFEAQGNDDDDIDDDEDNDDSDDVDTVMTLVLGLLVPCCFFFQSKAVTKL